MSHIQRAYARFFLLLLHAKRTDPASYAVGTRSRAIRRRTSNEDGTGDNPSGSVPNSQLLKQKSFEACNAGSAQERVHIGVNLRERASIAPLKGDNISGQGFNLVSTLGIRGVSKASRFTFLVGQRVPLCLLGKRTSSIWLFQFKCKCNAARQAYRG
jgi:hypothetical protein